MPTYDITVTCKDDIPDDVLVEHIAVAVKAFKESGKIEVKMARKHPFEGPVVFDDEPADVDELTKLDPFPLVTRAVDFLKKNR